ncbi:MAG: ornithine cyclodeaminase family protein [Gammaproteobacteria bacterium]|jgi:ornithine cyclodeaminase
MKILRLDEIKKIVNKINLLPIIEAGFVAYSQNQAVVPPVGELLFDNPSGDVHIKYGYLKNDDYYVIKIASGFYENPKINLPSSNGLMLLFSQKTGELISVLLDEGYLTDIRTAVAGAIAAKYLAPKDINAIGIIGTGIQARLQLKYLQLVTNCRKAIIWGRDENKLAAYQKELSFEGFVIHTTHDIAEVAKYSNLIVTTTPTKQPLLKLEHIRSGTHITAVGADTPDKQELESAIFSKADLIIADSILQCSERGEIAHAIADKIITKESIVELGQVIANKKLYKRNSSSITIADLTGVVVQDIQIAQAVYLNS